MSLSGGQPTQNLKERVDYAYYITACPPGRIWTPNNIYVGLDVEMYL